MLLKLVSHNTLSFEGRIKVNEYIHRKYLNITVTKSKNSLMKSKCLDYLDTYTIQLNYYLATNLICPAARYKSAVSEYQGL